MSNPNLIGATFDKMRVTPTLDSNIYLGLAGSDIIRLWGCDLHWNGLTLSIDQGAMLIKGRYIRIQGQSIPTTFPANFTGWFVLTIDLTKSNDSTGNPVYDNYSVSNNQVYFRYILDKDRRNEDITWAGKVYDLPIASCATDGTKFTKVEMKDGWLFNSPSPVDIRQMITKDDRVYAKQAMLDVTSSNKYHQFSLLLKRQGRRVTAQVNMKTVTTLAWEQLAELSNYPGYKPDGGDYSGMLNEMSYNTEPGGLYIGTTSLCMMHVGRTDVKECNYSGAITYFTNDDFPSDSDITSGYPRF